MLFTKSVATKAYLLSQRAFSTTNPSNFSYLIKSLPKTVPKLPHPGHVKSVNLWRNLFIVAGIPALLLINYNIEFLEDHHPPRPEFHPYEYMRKRAKVIYFVLLEYSLGSISLSIIFISFFKINQKFPWGDGNHSLFHNPYYNALPDGYEVDESEGGPGHGH